MYAKGKGPHIEAQLVWCVLHFLKVEFVSIEMFICVSVCVCVHLAQLVDV